MLMTPDIKFYLAGNKSPIDKHHVMWNKPIPGGSSDKDEPLTYGCYFNIIDTFLRKKLDQVLKKSNTSILDSEPVRVTLEKHGEFYHPARLDIITASEKTCHFVINLAASRAGIALITQEYHLLKKLNTSISSQYIPEVYIFSEQEITLGRAACLFIGNWFHGYHEFHQSCDPSTGNKNYTVWDQDKSNFYLSDRQVSQMYMKTAEILTSFYNPDTYEQILPWHHAAGDFIIKCNDDDADLKLITVRQYTSQIKQDDIPDIEDVLDALLYFLVNLSIRTRLDRNNGTEETVWSDDLAVSPTVSGFFNALKKTNSSVIPGSLPVIFCHFIELNYTLQDFQALAESILPSYNQKSSDYPLIQRNLRPHITLLYQEIKKFDQLNHKS